MSTVFESMSTKRKKLQNTKLLRTDKKDEKGEQMHYCIWVLKLLLKVIDIPVFSHTFGPFNEANSKSGPIMGTHVYG